MRIFTVCSCLYPPIIKIPLRTVCFLVLLWNSRLSPLCPNISMHILHTVLYTFPKELTRRICLIIKNLVGDHFLYSPVLDVLFNSDIVRRN